MADWPLDSTTLTQRLTLIGVARLSADGETPAHAGDIARTCARRIGALDGDVVGSISEAEVTRALNELDAEGAVEAVDADERSPVGKGRPAYELRVERATLTEAFGDDDRLERLLDDLD